MSKIEVDQVDPQSGTTLTLGTSGDTVSVPSGVTLANAGTVTGIPASAISSGTIATARLGSGTASSSTFLRGDQTYAEAGGGKIGQVVSTTKTDTFSESVATEAFSNIVTGLTVNITPSASSSKILVFVTIIVGAAGEHGLAFQLFRDTTQIDLGDASGSRARLSKGRVFNYAGSDADAPLSTNFLDTPSSTSALTYGIKIGHSSGSAKTLYINRSDNDPDDLSYGRATSTITVMEILA